MRQKLSKVHISSVISDVIRSFKIKNSKDIRSFKIKNSKDIKFCHNLDFSIKVQNRPLPNEATKAIILKHDRLSCSDHAKVAKPT